MNKKEIFWIQYASSTYSTIINKLRSEGLTGTELSDRLDLELNQEAFYSQPDKLKRIMYVTFAAKLLAENPNDGTYSRIADKLLTRGGVAKGLEEV